MQKPLAATPAATTSLRRAADVAVVGGSLQAYAAAYMLAKRGKRVVVIEHAASELVAAGAAARRPDIALHLPATTPHLVNEATEALALWRGVEAASGARNLLRLCGSIDIAPIRGSSQASDVLGMMQDASKAAGLSFGMLSPEEITAAFPRLRPPSGTAGLYTNLGGVLSSRVAAAVLLGMAQRAGADVVAPGGRALLGWRDGGSYFALRTASAAAAAAAAGSVSQSAAASPAVPATAAAGGDEVVYECEQLVLLPDAAVQQASLALFGLAVPGAQLWQVPAGRWQAQEECAQMPVWQLLRSGSTRTVDDPSALDACWGLPVLDWAAGSVLVAQSLADGEPAAQQQSQRQQQDPGQAPAAAAGGSTGTGVPLEQALAGAGAGDAGAEAMWALQESPGSEEAVDAERQRQADQQRQQQVAEQRMATAGGLAGRLVNGVGGRLAGRDVLLQCIVTPDGEPAAGSHPGHEAGRLVAAFPASGGSLGCLPGTQLAPLVARLAVSELLGLTPEAINAAAVALGREVLQAEQLALQHDSWAELGRNL